MENKRDIEIHTMRKETGITLIELSNVIGVSYNTLVQKIGGYRQYKPGEREKLIEFIKAKQNEKTAV